MAGIIRRGGNSHKILNTLAISAGFLAISLISPGSSGVIVQGLVRGYFRRRSFEKHRFLRDIRRLQRLEMLDFRELADGNIRITLLKNGRRFVLTDKLDNLKIKRPIAWDGKWRLVIFDIPHDQRRARDAFREKLTDLGFHQLQKSVFIIPFPCEKELDFIMTYWNVQDHVLLLYVSSFEGEAKLKHHFGL